MKPQRTLLATLIAVALATAVRADQPPPAVARFLIAHCGECHAGAAAEAGLAVDDLGFDPADSTTERRWARLIERVEAGEMPPADAPQPMEVAREDFVRQAGDWLRDEIARRDAEFGRVRARRLSRREVERSLHALLGIDIPLANSLPDEGRPRGFTTVADRQTMSHHRLERHLAVVDMALDEAFRRALQPAGSDDYSRDFDAVGISRTDPKARTREPELLDGRGVIWSNGIIYYGRVPATAAPADGWYRFRLRVAALNPPATGGVWSTINAGLCVSSAPLLEFVTAFEAGPESREIVFETWLPRRHMLEIRPGDSTLKQARFEGGQVGAGEGGPQQVPGIAMERLAMERFHRGPDDEGVRRLVFGHVSVGDDRKAGRPRPHPSAPQEDLATLIEAFARRAFRRPVEPAHIAPIVAMARQVLDDGEGFDAALRAGYRTILCSPRFLHLTEEPGPLDHHAIAARLSYFLTGGPPDGELAALAEAGRLRDAATLRRQTDRLLGLAGAPTAEYDGGPLRRFVRDFAAEWLDLDQIDFTEPDRKLYPGFDQVVQQSMLAETHAFLEEAFRDNRPVSALVAADVTYLNSRLARFYAIDGVAGDALARVSLAPATHRGGLLTQGAILKVTANGNNTSPVVRGVFVAERLLGVDVPPPPANVPAIEPDIRGATTIRDQLARHRADAACSSCHRTIDPLGFALENFDPSGRWRDRYLAMQGGKKKGGLPIDAADVLPDGASFSGADEFRAVLAARPEQLGRGLAGQMLVYGTGATLSFKDREVVAEIAAAAAAENHGVRSILHAVITHPVFLGK
jgi:hypothetical protein